MTHRKNLLKEMALVDKCPECGQKPEFKPDSHHLYQGRDYGPVYECPCGARVGCHKGTKVPLGTVANEATRKARKDAHAWFDQLWQDPIHKLTRKEAYKWLASVVDVDIEDCHIGQFNVEQCLKVCEAAKARNPLLPDSESFMELIL